MVIKEKSVVQKKEAGERRVPNGFLFVLSIVSIFGFFGIAMRTLFNIDLNVYIEALWLFVLGGGMLKESNMPGLMKIKKLV